MTLNNSFYKELETKSEKTQKELLKLTTDISKARGRYYVGVIVKRPDGRTIYSESDDYAPNKGDTNGAIALDIMAIERSMVMMAEERVGSYPLEIKSKLEEKSWQENLL